MEHKTGCLKIKSIFYQTRFPKQKIIMYFHGLKIEN